ncbi:MAG: hypothetical protein Q9176_007517 [Flavoplaca citrina]
MSITQKSILSALLFISSILASPLSSSSTFEPLSTRSVINCTSLTAQRNVACWDSLNIASYLTNWRNTTPDCTISNDKALDLESGRLNDILEAFNIDNKDIISPAHLGSILSIPIVLGLNVIATTTPPPLPHALELSHLYTTALLSTPSLQTALFPPTTPLNTQTLPFTTTNTTLPTPLSLLTSALNTTLSSLPTFLSFAANGTFSSSASLAAFLTPNPNLNLRIGAYTFLTSRLLQTQNVYAIPGEIVDFDSFKSPCPVGSKPVQGKCPFGNWENCGEMVPIVRNGTAVQAVEGEGGSAEEDDAGSAVEDDAGSAAAEGGE